MEGKIDEDRGGLLCLGKIFLGSDKGEKSRRMIEEAEEAELQTSFWLD
ncbi:MAG: hypothetical protein QW828_02590 [Candidatus Bathyarchaeia archaeon]